MPDSSVPSQQCPDCGMPMQIYNEVKHEDFVIQRTFLCSCKGPVRYHNVHYGASK
jgi:hypothetical protein